MKQQVFELTLKSDLTFANFWVSERYRLPLQKMQNILPGEIIYLWGKSSSELTHLGQAACHHYQHQGQPSLYLDLVNLADYAEMLLHALEGFKLIVFDNLEAALNNPQNEKLLFDIYNRALAEGISLVWLAHTPPEQLPCQLADLKSRLSASLVLQLPEMSDEDKIKVLQYCAKRRGIKLNDNVANFLLTNYSREIKNLLLLIDQLDNASLQAKKTITIPFIKKHLGLKQLL